jgi:hypothetical protein
MKPKNSLKCFDFPHKSRLFCSVILAAVFGFIGPISGDDLSRQQSQDNTAIESRLKHTVEYLSSDELQGRGPGTEGIDNAADFIAKRMDKIGLKSNLFHGSAYQNFYVRQANGDGGQGSVNVNIFSWPGDAIAAILAKLSDSSPQDEPPDDPAKHAGELKLKNIAAVLEGVGPLADETIVVGAHYDHLGQFKMPDGRTIVYHGANDNASGVAVMLETAELLARREKLHRRIVFVAFSGEELGLLGSLHYLNHPAVPLNKTVAMINLDVVGHMENEALVSMMSSSPDLAKSIDGIVKRHNLKLDEMSWVYPVSDHAGFYARGIPAVFFMPSGDWNEMHTPADTADTLNYPGMREIAKISADLVADLAQTEKRPDFADENPLRMLYRSALWTWCRLSN